MDQAAAVAARRCSLAARRSSLGARPFSAGYQIRCGWRPVHTPRWAELSGVSGAGAVRSSSSGGARDIATLGATILAATIAESVAVRRSSHNGSSESRGWPTYGISASRSSSTLKKHSYGASDGDVDMLDGASTAAESAALRRLIKEQTSLIRKTSQDCAELRVQLELMRDELRHVRDGLEQDQAGMRPRVQRKGRSGLGAQSRAWHRPSIDCASKQITHVCELGHHSLAELAMIGNHSAHRERLLREIMCVDGVSWDTAHEVLAEFDKSNERYYWVESLPYRVGITAAIILSVVSTMLVFWKPVAEAYAIHFAGEGLPENVEDISEMTVNNVGTWTWQWMEPMIGTASFVLLCCQFGRAQARKMNMKTYGEVVLQWRANRLARCYPNYDRSMVRAWAKHMPRVGLNFFPQYESHVGKKGPTSGL